MRSKHGKYKIDLPDITNGKLDLYINGRIIIIARSVCSFYHELPAIINGWGGVFDLEDKLVIVRHTSYVDGEITEFLLQGKRFKTFDAHKLRNRKGGYPLTIVPFDVQDKIMAKYRWKSPTNGAVALAKEYRLPVKVVTRIVKQVA